jgi:catechol 2,3-dioxygenase-like lactoylglutathione lyase family enzyme
MSVRTIVPVFTTERLRESREFRVTKLGFRISLDRDHDRGLRAGAKGAPGIAFPRPDSERPDAFAGRGASFSIEVADADRECERWRSLGVPVLAEPKDRAWGSRGLVAVDPDGVVLFVSQPIPAAMEFQACIRQGIRRAPRRSTVPNRPAPSARARGHRSVARARTRRLRAPCQTQRGEAPGRVSRLDGLSASLTIAFPFRLD